MPRDSRETHVMLSTKRIRCCAALLLTTLLATPAQADVGCCAECGCHTPCRKVCRLVCEEKKVDVTCWGCKCEEFCVPNPSCPGCRHCKTVCADCKAKCDPKAPHTEPKAFVWFNWFPNGARIYTRAKLMKKTETVTVPGYKWVVEDLCQQCAANSVTKENAEMPKDNKASNETGVAREAQVAESPHVPNQPAWLR